jgi:hypothetical protein
MQLKSKELGSIQLSTKDTDMLVITFRDENNKQFAEIRLRGMESDEVVKRIKANARDGRR